MRYIQITTTLLLCVVLGACSSSSSSSSTKGEVIPSISIQSTHDLSTLLAPSLQASHQSGHTAKAATYLAVDRLVGYINYHWLKAHPENKQFMLTGQQRLILAEAQFQSIRGNKIPLYSNTEFLQLIKKHSHSNKTITPQHISERQSHFRTLLPQLTPNLPGVYPLESLIICWSFQMGDLGDGNLSSLPPLEKKASSNSSVAGLFDDIVDGYNNFKNGVDDTVEDIVDGAEDTYNGIKNGVDDTVNDISEGAEDAYNNVKNALDLFADRSFCDEAEYARHHKDCRRNRPSPPGNGSSYSPISYLTASDIFEVMEGLSQLSYFDNSNPPAEALAILPSSPSPIEHSFIASAKSGEFQSRRNESVAEHIERATAAAEAPDDGQEFGKEWWREKKNLFRKGDLCFFRRWNTVGQLISYISSWNHIALIYNVERGLSLESIPGGTGGVQQRQIETDWERAVSFSAKRISPFSLSPERVSELVDIAANKYLNKMPYFNTMEIAASLAGPDRLTQLGLHTYRWYNKHITFSMYCSKFVWHVFKSDIDLDSNRFALSGTVSHALGKYDADELTIIARKVTHLGARIGVTPDEIYYSRHLESDIEGLHFGLSNLLTPQTLSIKSLTYEDPQQTRRMPRILRPERISATKKIHATQLTTYKNVIIESNGELSINVSKEAHFTPGFTVKRGGQLDIHYD